jgi:magnesium-protoporphyrin IX monomethyl ester (oxidative) cyclase
MRVLLLNPPYQAPKYAGLGISFPMGLAYLGAALQKAGIEMRALDAAAAARPVEVEKDLVRYGLEPKELHKRIADIKPDVVGISCFFSSRFPAVLEAAKIIKDIDNKIITITGGIHPSLMPESVGSHPEIDFAAVGEGERIIVDFVEAASGKASFDDIEGLTFKKDGRVIVNPRSSYIEDLDSLGFPAWNLFDMERYLTINEGRWGLGYGRYAPVVTSRSCPYRCTFCSIHSVMGPKYRAHSPGYVVEMIEALVGEYGVDEISFEDDNLTYDKDRFVSICKGLVERKIKIRWNTPNGVHVGSLDRDSLEWAKEAGCDSLNLAVESGDDFIRNKVIKKGLNSEKIYEVAEACREAEIKANAYFVIGMPGETEDSISKSQEYIRDLKFNNLSIFIATPMPGTKLYDECIEKRYIDVDSFDTDFISYQAAIFTQPSIRTPEFDREKIMIWRHRLYVAYYRATLRDRFWGWLFTHPRASVSMMMKIALYMLFGARLSYKLTNLIAGFVKR